MKVRFANTKSWVFVEKLNEDLRPEAVSVLKLLENYGNNVGMPHSKPLGKGLFELRIVGQDHIRFIYTFYLGDAWVLNAFFKRSQKIPKKEIDYARRQLKILLS